MERLKGIKRNAIISLLVFTIILGMGTFMYQSRAAEAKEEYRVTVDRAPRVSFKLNERDKITVQFKDRSRIDKNSINIDVMEENENWKSVNYNIIEDNKLTIEKYYYTKLEINTSEFTQKFKLKIKVNEEENKFNMVEAKYIFKKLDKQNSKKNWFAINNPPRLAIKSQAKSTEQDILKNFQLELEDKNGVDSVVISDGNDYVKMQSLSYSNKTTVDVNADLTKFKQKNGKYRLIVETVSQGETQGTGKIDAIEVLVEKKTISSEPTLIPITEVKADADNMKLMVGESRKLNITINPTNTTESKKITYTSSDEKIATVDENGNIKGVSVGKTTITAKVGSHSVKCEVEVEPAREEMPTITMEPAKLELKVGEKKALTIKSSKSIKDEKNTYKTECNIEDDKIATSEPNEIAEDGMSWTINVEGKDVGTTNVIAVLSNIYTGQQVKVNGIVEVEVETEKGTPVFEATYDKDELEAGEEGTIEVKNIGDGDMQDHKVVAESQDEDVATIGTMIRRDDVVAIPYYGATNLKEDTETKIVIKIDDEEEREFTVKVKAAEEPELKMNYETLEIVAGQTAELEVKGINEKELEWNIVDEQPKFNTSFEHADVVELSSTVKINKEENSAKLEILGGWSGTATVVATTEDGREAKCKVTVKDASLENTPSSMNMKVGETKKIEIKLKEPSKEISSYDIRVGDRTDDEAVELISDKIENENTLVFEYKAKKAGTVNMLVNMMGTEAFWKVTVEEDKKEEPNEEPKEETTSKYKLSINRGPSIKSVVSNKNGLVITMKDGNKIKSIGATVGDANGLVQDYSGKNEEESYTIKPSDVKTGKTTLKISAVDVNGNQSYTTYKIEKLSKKTNDKYFKIYAKPLRVSIKVIKEYTTDKEKVFKPTYTVAVPSGAKIEMVEIQDLNQDKKAIISSKATSGTIDLNEFKASNGRYHLRIDAKTTDGLVRRERLYITAYEEGKKQEIIDDNDTEGDDIEDEDIKLDEIEMEETPEYEIKANKTELKAGEEGTIEIKNNGDGEINLSGHEVVADSKDKNIVTTGALVRKEDMVTIPYYGASDLKATSETEIVVKIDGKEVKTIKVKVVKQEETKTETAKRYKMKTNRAPTLKSIESNKNGLVINMVDNNGIESIGVKVGEPNELAKNYNGKKEASYTVEPSKAKIGKSRMSISATDGTNQTYSTYLIERLSKKTDGKYFKIVSKPAKISIKVEDTYTSKSKALKATYTVSVPSNTKMKSVKIEDLNQNQKAIISNKATSGTIDLSKFKAINGKYHLRVDMETEQGMVKRERLYITEHIEGETQKTEPTNNVTNSTEQNKVQTTVQDNGPYAIRVNPSSKSLQEGETVNLRPTFEPAKATNRGVTWKSNNTKVAVVDNNGKVTAKGAGKATITVTSTQDKTVVGKCSIEVKAKEVKATGIKLSESRTITLKEGKTSTLKATVSPSNATNKEVAWKSSDTKVATVSNGKITAKGKGTAKITATTKDGSKKSVSITVKVEAKTVAVSKIKLNKTSATFKKGKSGQTLQLQATVSPSNATNKKVTWSSSSPAVATVDTKGKVTIKNCKKDHKVTITAKADGKTAKCIITVK